MPRLLVSCGEPSGDLYAGELVARLREEVADVSGFGLGGDHLARQGFALAAHVRELAVVGLVEVVQHLPRFRAIFRDLLREVDRLRPDLAVLVDYPDFNLRLARELARRGIRVVYYVSPQVWAWRRGRIATIRRTAARMLVIFPFEEDLYRSQGVPVSFVGHPLVDLVRPAADRAAFLGEIGCDPGRPVVAVLPGSRPKEVGYNLPPLVEAARRLATARPELQVLLALAPTLDRRAIEAAIVGSPLRVVPGRTHAVVASAALALVASGTATVETALLGTPMVVVYRIASLSYLLGRPFVRVPHYAMVNLIAGERLVPELIQAEFTPERVVAEALSLLDDAGRRGAMRRGLSEVRRRLGEPGASRRAAREVAALLAAPGA